MELNFFKFQYIMRKKLICIILVLWFILRWVHISHFHLFCASEVRKPCSPLGATSFFRTSSVCTLAVTPALLKFFFTCSTLTPSLSLSLILPWPKQNPVRLSDLYSELTMCFTPASCFSIILSILLGKLLRSKSMTSIFLSGSYTRCLEVDSPLN